MMRERVLIYPYTESALPLIKYFDNFCSDKCIKRVATEGGLGIIGEDIGAIDNRSNKIGYIVEKYSEQSFEDIDTLIVPSFDMDISIINEIKNAIDYALSHGINATVAMNINDDAFVEEMKEKAKKCGCIFNYLSINNEYMDSNLLGIDLPYHTPRSCIIFVASLCLDDHKYESTLAIVKGLIDKGHRATGLCLSQDARVLGLHAIPSYLDISNGINGEWIKKMNQYIEAIERYENPEAIVVEIPGNLFRFDNFITGDFGLWTYAFKEAMPPDYIHACTVINYSQQANLERLSKASEKNFGNPIDSVHVTNAIKNAMESSSLTSYVHIHIDDKKIYKQIIENRDSSAIPRFMLTYDEEIEALAEHILKKLS